jgi:hypothetical protein
MKKAIAVTGHGGHSFRHSIDIQRRNILVGNIVLAMNSISGEYKDDIIYERLIQIFRINHHLGMAVAKSLGIIRGDLSLQQTS